MSDLIRPTHAQALETYWRQLELTPHQHIEPSVMAYTGRAAILRDSFVRTNGVIGYDVGIVNGKAERIRERVLAMNWTELGVVPVGGQGLTDNERKLCKWAGQAMAAFFAEEAAK